MGSLRQLPRELSHWLRKSPRELSHGQRTLRWWIDLARHCAGELRRDRASQMAAALTYHTLFSLFPTTVLMLVVLHSFVGEADRAEFKETVITWMLRPLQQAELIHDPGAASGQDASGRRQEFEDLRGSLGVKIQETMDKLESVSFRSIGIAGILLFIYAATGLLSTIESSFNAVYGAASGRPPYLRLPLYYTVITLGPMVVLAGQVLQRKFFDLLATEAWAGWLAGSLAVLTPLLAAWLTLWLFYVLLPNTRVSLRMAVGGSFVGAVLWVVALQLFALYVERAAISTLYGALALVPLFLFWLWVTWLIILFGLELTYALQSMREGRFRYRKFHDDERPFIDRAVVLPLMARVARTFGDGALCPVSDLSRALQLPPDTVTRLIRPLEQANLLHFVMDDHGGGYTLSRPADTMAASEVLAAAESLGPAREGHIPEDSLELLDQLFAKFRGQMEGTTVAELATRLEAPGSGS